MQPSGLPETRPMASNGETSFPPSATPAYRKTSREVTTPERTGLPQGNRSWRTTARSRWHLGHRVEEASLGGSMACLSAAEVAKYAPGRIGCRRPSSGRGRVHRVLDGPGCSCRDTHD